MKDLNDMMGAKIAFFFFFNVHTNESKVPVR